MHFFFNTIQYNRALCREYGRKMQERWLRGHVTDDFLWEKKRIRLRIRIRIGFIFVFCVTHLTQLQLPVCCPLFSATGNYHLRNTGDLFFLSDTVQPLKLHASTLAIIKLRHQSARTRAAQLQIARAITTRKSWSRLGRWGGQNGAVDCGNTF